MRMRSPLCCFWRENFCRRSDLLIWSNFRFQVSGSGFLSVLGSRVCGRLQARLQHAGRRQEGSRLRKAQSADAAAAAWCLRAQRQREVRRPALRGSRAG